MSKLRKPRVSQLREGLRSPAAATVETAAPLKLRNGLLDARLMFILIGLVYAVHHRHAPSGQRRGAPFLFRPLSSVDVNERGFKALLLRSHVEAI